MRWVEWGGVGWGGVCRRNPTGWMRVGGAAGTVWRSPAVAPHMDHPGCLEWKKNKTGGVSGTELRVVVLLTGPQTPSPLWADIAARPCAIHAPAPGSLVVVDVHARDVVTHMAEQGVSNIRDFNWCVRFPCRAGWACVWGVCAYARGWWWPCLCVRGCRHGCACARIFFARVGLGDN